MHLWDFTTNAHKPDVKDAMKDDLSRMTASLPDAIVKVRLLFGFVKFIIPFMVGRC